MTGQKRVWRAPQRQRGLRRLEHAALTKVGEHDAEGGRLGGRRPHRGRARGPRTQRLQQHVVGFQVVVHHTRGRQGLRWARRGVNTDFVIL